MSTLPVLLSTSGSFLPVFIVFQNYNIFLHYITEYLLHILIATNSFTSYTFPSVFLSFQNTFFYPSEISHSYHCNSNSTKVSN